MNWKALRDSVIVVSLAVAIPYGLHLLEKHYPNAFIPVVATLLLSLMIYIFYQIFNTKE
jgi:hypothetical protein